MEDGEWSDGAVKWLVARRAPAGSYMHTWCNGAPGLALLWAKAYETSADPRFIEFARGCGRQIIGAVRLLSHMCCGSAGQVYALLALSRIEPSGSWKSAALAIAERAICREKLDGFSESLFKGRAGLLCMSLDVLDRLWVCFPCIEVPRIQDDVASSDVCASIF
jgi:hypothetical protein